MPKGNLYSKSPLTTAYLVALADFLIGLKAATYPLSGPTAGALLDDAGSADPSGLHTQSRMFPRGVLHPSSLPASDNSGKKTSRGYVLCKRSAVADFVTTKGAESPVASKQYRG